MSMQDPKIKTTGEDAAGTIIPDVSQEQVPEEEKKKEAKTKFEGR